MLIAAPGVGKTAFALNWAAWSSALTLYVSADTDPKLMTAQLAAMATGQARGLVEERLSRSRAWREAYIDAIRHKFPHLVMDFTANSRIDVVAAKAEALTEVWGETPQLIVLDTASDIEKPGSDYKAWDQTWRDIRTLTRYLNCVVLVAHHVKAGPAANGDRAPEQGDGEYKADKYAEIVLGLHRPTGNTLRVSVLKNRGGKSRFGINLHADYEYGMIREFEREAA